jgi:hypothetical protein
MKFNLAKQNEYLITLTESRYGRILSKKEKETKKKYYEDLFKVSRKIMPQRYIWHVAYPMSRNSIFEHGILPFDSGCVYVYANNQIHNPLALFPICFDISAGFCYSETLDEILNQYDFWRIDCNVAGYDGYRIDPNNPKVLFKPFAKDEDYICRERAIPREALKLFRYKTGSIDSYMAKDLYNQIFCKYGEGAVSISTVSFVNSRTSYLEEVNVMELYSSALAA